MDPSLLRALDTAIEAGGRDLTGRAIAGTGSAATEVLKKLCDLGHLEKRGTKYAVTPGGLAGWERESPAERVTQVQESNQLKKAEAMLAFLAIVETKGGRPFTRPEATKHGAAIQEALDRRLMVQSGRAQAYTLQPAGTRFLLFAFVEQQMARLRELQRAMGTGQTVVLQRLEQTQPDVNGRVQTELPEVLTELKQRAAQAQTAYEVVLKEMAAFARLNEAAAKLRDSLLAESEPLLRQVEEESARLRTREERLQEALEQQRRELEAFKEQLEARLASLTPAPENNPSAKSSPAEPPPSPPQPDETAVWAATQRGYAELRRASVIVKIPELYDRVNKAVLGLTVQGFHQMLKVWQREDRLVLQICNDPHVESRAAEGIHSDRGLLFYIHIR